MGLASKIQAIAGRVFSINVLSLYLFRRAVGLVLSTELCFRATSFILSPDGSFSFLSQKSELRGSLSFVEIALGICAVFLALGYHRLVVLVSTWALLLLRFLPDYGQTSYGFKILQSVFFWTLFLPSTDKRLSHADWPHTNVFSLASVGALLQIAIVYLTAGITKSSDCWWVSGDAMSRTIEFKWGDSEPFRTLLEQEGLLRLMSRLIFAAEVAAPVLILSPVKTDFFRTIAVAFFMSMHVGIALLMRIGAFAYLCLATWLLFLPAAFWEWARITPHTQHVVPESRQLEYGHVNAVFAIEEPAIRRTSRWNVVLCLALVYVLTTNLAQWTGAAAYTNLRKIGYVVGLDQQWIMFNNPCRFREIKS